MCWYYRVRYSCGGEVWGSRQRQCLKSKQNDATKPGEKCTLRRFTRRLHDGAECPVCCGDQQRQHENPDVDCATAHQQPLRDLFARCEYEPRNTDKDLWKIWFALLRFTTRGPYGRAELDRVSAPVFCRRCTSQSGHEGPHKLQCPEIDCTLPPDHEDSHGILPHFRWCDDPECGKEVGHSGPHRFAQGWQPCTTTLECTRGLGHEGDHSYLSVARQDSRTIDEKLGEVVQEHSRRASQLNRLVLVAMGAQAAQERSFPGVQAKLDQEQRQTRVIQRVRRDHGDKQAAITLPFATGSTYERLDYQSGQIRLFELQPSPNGESIIGSFIYTNLGACPEYTALSYAWGDTTEYGSIKISDDKEISIAENLWRFLLVQSRSISEPRFFWIDAICIDQDNVDERNHQVALMEAHLLPRSRGSTSGWARPRPTASWPWTFLAHRASRAPAAQKGLGTPPVWTDHEGAALRDLCEREYWRRMWIIQEVIHADRIRVWCGARNIDWAVFDRLYLTLKTLEDTSWFAHHRYVMPVLQSFAFTMVWQRAHWRHPETPRPTLQTLVEIFQDWKCSDVRDKVYALVGMASTKVVPDYSRSTKQVYYDVLNCPGGVQDRERFCNLLSQLLGLSRDDVDLDEQNLIEYKTHSADVLVLRERLDSYSWGSSTQYCIARRQEDGGGQWHGLS